MSKSADNTQDDTRYQEELFQKGEELFRAQAYSKAAIVFERLHQMSPDSPAPIRLGGLCNLRLGRFQKGLRALERALSLAPDDPYARLHYGMGLHSVGRSQDAADFFSASNAQLPDDPAPVLNLCSAFLALEKPKEALEAAIEARRRAPDLPQANYMVGQAYLALGRPDKAEYALSRVLTLAPEFTGAWVAFGVARYRQYDLGQAIASMHKALALDPLHVAAVANLAAFLRILGQSDTGEDLLRRTLAERPQADEIRLNLSVSLLQDDRPAEALALMETRDCPKEPVFAAHWQLQLVSALLAVGRLQDARRCLDGLSDLPDDLRGMAQWRNILLAQAGGDSKTAQIRASEMEAGLESAPGVLPEAQIMTHFDLAKFWSGENKPDQAFPHWVEGHRILARFQPFSRTTHRRTVDAVIQNLDKARLTGGPHASNNDRTPVFIVGMPRSGTTLTEQILAAHNQGFGAGERSALGRTVGEMAQGKPRDAIARIAAMDQDELDRVAESYLFEMHALAPDADRIIDKMPGNFMYLGVAALLFPGAKFVHCTRDLRDIGLSIFMHRFFGEHGYAHDLRDLGWYMGQYSRLMTHWESTVPDRILTVALTDWIQDFDGTLDRVLDYVDLPYDPACARFFEQDTPVRTVSRKQVREPVNDRGIGRWRLYEEHLQPLIEELRRAELD